jgi:hypothetical protein
VTEGVIWQQTYALASKETKAISINDIVTKGLPDDEGHVVPATATRGTASWAASMKNPATGRLLESHPKAGLARNFACGTCPHMCSGGGMSYLNTYSSLTGNVGSDYPLGSVTVYECTGCTRICGGPKDNKLDTYDAFDYSWTNNSIVSTTSGSVDLATYLVNAAGASSITYMAEISDETPPCQAPGNAPTTGKPNLVVQGNPYIFVGSDPQLAYANRYTATVTPAGGTFSVMSSNPSDTFTSGSTSGKPWVSISTQTQSNTPLDRTLTFSYTYNTTAQQAMKVTARQFAYATNSAPANTCSLGYGTSYAITYTVYTHPDKTAVDAQSDLDGTKVIESFTPSILCGVDTGDGALDANSQFIDRIAYCKNVPLTCTGSVTQTLTVGGYGVRTNNLTYSSSQLFEQWSKSMKTIITVVLSFVVGSNTILYAEQVQGEATRRPVLLLERLSEFELVDGTFMDGIRKLTRLGLPLNLGVEQVIRDKYSDSPTDVRFSLRLSNASVKVILDTLCAYDGRYTWSTDGDTVNVYPRSVVGDSKYFLNRQLDHITMKDIPDPDEALTPLDRQLPPPREPFGYIQMGGDISYTEPWTVTFEHITVRQFINKVAEHLGRESVWVFQGSGNDRLFTFQRGGLNTPTTRKNLGQ